MKTVLFAWELGAGSGHVTTIRRLAQRLASRDIRLVAAVTSLAAIHVLDGVVSEIHRMPNWRSNRVDPRTGQAPSSATLNDILVGAGLADTVLVQETVAPWLRLLRAIDPALVIADFAPAAALAARRRIPLLMVGNGFTLPPHGMHAFPPLHGLSAPVHREDDTLAAINTAARNLGLCTLDHLPQLFSGDASVVHTLPLLDPYAEFREAPADGPLIDYVPRVRDADARDIFVYISQGVEVRPDLVAALLPVGSLVRIHAPMLSDEAREKLARSGARIEVEPVDLSQALPACRLVVHLGGNGLASEAVLAGVPQFMLVTHVEQHLTGIALERAGAGRLFTAYDPSQVIPANTIADLHDDDGMLKCATWARQHATSRTAAVRMFDRACERLLK